MKYTKEQFERLPKWAQTEITRLQMEVTDLKNRLSQFNGESETNTFVSNLLETTPLPNNSQIEFRVGAKGNNRVRAYINRDGHVDINTDSRMGQTMVIMPRAANSFYITFVNL